MHRVTSQVTRPPTGSSRQRPRRGRAYVHRHWRRRPHHHGPRSAALLTRHPGGVLGDQLALLGDQARAAALSRAVEEVLALAPGADAYCRVPMWSGAQRWARVAVPVAYALHHERLRAAIPHDAVSLKTLVKVADARARYADGRSGRHCRPTNATLAALAGVTERTVRRATRWLAALGCATEILRGRQRTKRERLATWRLGSKARGWASVWALHNPRPVVDNSRDSNGLWRPVSHRLSTHPRRGSISVENSTLKNPLPTAAHVHNLPKAGQGPPTQGGAPRHAYTKANRGPAFAAVDEGGRLLAVRWLADGQTPAWAARHTPRGWARLLAGPAAHGWTPRDLNLLIHEWAVVDGNYLPESPYRPIGLLGAILCWHGQLDAPPAALERARDAAERAHRLACDERDRAESRRARANAATVEQRAAAKRLFASLRSTPKPPRPL